MHILPAAKIIATAFLLTAAEPVETPKVPIGVVYSIHSSELHQASDQLWGESENWFSHTIYFVGFPSELPHLQVV